MVPKVLILGHSFVKRLFSDIKTGFDARVDVNLALQGTVLVQWHGTGGRTVAKLRAFDLCKVHSSSPDIIILEVGTNDLSNLAPETVGSAIEELVQLFLRDFSVQVVGVCYVISRGISHPDASLFDQRAQVLNQYLSVVLGDVPNVFCWRHVPFNHPAKDFYLADGVHLNSSGQYLLYRSYRGAVLKAVSLL